MGGEGTEAMLVEVGSTPLSNSSKVGVTADLSDGDGDGVTDNWSDGASDLPAAGVR